MPAVGAATAALRPLLEQALAGDLTPAIAAIVVTPRDVPLLFAAGYASTRDRTPATPDTLFYLASQTKSWVGLLAALLHRRGTFRLDTRLAEIWPGLALPGSCETLSMLHVLTHRLPLGNDALETRTLRSISNGPAHRLPS